MSKHGRKVNERMDFTMTTKPRFKETISVEDVRQRHIDLEVAQEEHFKAIQDIRKEMGELFDTYWDLVHLDN